MMPGCTQTTPIRNVIIFHDDSVYRIGKVLRLECANSIAHLLLRMRFGQEDIGHNRKTTVLQQLLLGQFALMLQRITDQVERPEFQFPFPGFAGVQLSHTASSQVARMRVVASQTEIDLLKIVPGDDAFAAHLKWLPNGYGEWDIQKGTDRMGHVFADDTIPATGNGLLQAAVLVPEHDRQPVHFPAEQHGSTGGELDQIFDLLGLSR